MIKRKHTRLQRGFDVLVDVFDWVVLRKKLGKTVRMCHPVCAIGGHSVEACGLQMTEEILTHRKRLNSASNILN